MADLHVANGTNTAGAPVDAWITDSMISDVSETSSSIDATGLVVAPGFIDIQLNGAYGRDFTLDPTSIWEVGARLPEFGVTSFCPTIITSPPGYIGAAQTAIADRPQGYRGAEPIGLHIEGPYISYAKCGTHPKELLISSAPEHFDTTHIAIVTVAPELPGVIEFIERLVAAGVVVSLGHSSATAAQATLALDAGATLGTHLFNAMAPMAGREPGLAGVLITDPRARFGAIVDGIHLAPEMLRMAWSSAKDRFILVTDGIAAIGMAEGSHDIGWVPVSVANGAVRNAEGDLAGSVLTMDTAITVLMETTSANLGDAVKAATLHPAAALGRSDLGSLSTGARGDLVLLEGTTVVATVVGGEILFCNQPDRVRGPRHVPEI